MDFKLTKEQEELKKQYEDFFKAAMKDAPQAFKDFDMEAMYSGEEEYAFFRRMAGEFGKRGWLSLPWPKEYGGSEASIMEQLIFNDALEASGCPGYDMIGLGMFAPTLLVSGSEEQKKRLLPPMARGEVMYCQGWSEPDAGSDLANLSTTAIRDGDEYVVNGQKVWTTGAHRADAMFLLARTDPNAKRSKGLSFFHLDMKTPGIEVRPLYFMNNTHVYNEVYFKDARIQARDLIGGEGNGWAVTMNTMNFERSGMAVFTRCGIFLKKIINYAKTTKRNGRYLSKDPVIRQKIAKLHAEIEGGRMMAYRVAAMQEKGGLIMAASTASESKVFGSEVMRRLYCFATEVLGPYGIVEKSQWAPFGNAVGDYQFSTALSIAGGTNEIQRSIISWMPPLKMPRLKLVDPTKRGL